MGTPDKIRIENLTMAYGDRVLQKGLTFQVRTGEVMVIMGGSGCGKSTLLRHLLGLKEPREGKVYYDDVCFTDAELPVRQAILRRCGVLYQGGALWSSMTVEENVALPLQEFTGLDRDRIREIVDFKLSLVGLQGFQDYYPAELSGGMRKRAGLARAVALDPEILFFDEPSAGLDPVSSHNLDETILQLKETLGTTIVMITHELPSIFAVADRALYLDAEARELAAVGRPADLLANPPSENIRAFLTRNAKDVAS
ncbi:MAG: ABC transporter ATP-binding protein [Opitutales bacterium]|jgi:phospholipid/cholesterol/gamma-HCH transport system ATP-binding protein